MEYYLLCTIGLMKMITHQQTSEWRFLINKFKLLKILIMSFIIQNFFVEDFEKPKIKKKS